MADDKTPTNKRSVRKQIAEELEAVTKKAADMTQELDDFTAKFTESLQEVTNRYLSQQRAIEKLKSEAVARDARIADLESRLLKNRIKRWIRLVRSKLSRS